MRYKREIETQKDRLILGSNLRVTSSSVCLCVWSVHFFISKGCQHRIPASLFKSDLPGMVENQNRFSLLFLSFVVLVGSTSHLSLSRLPMNVSHRWFFSTKQESTFPGLEIFFHLIHFFYFLSSKVFPVRENATAAWHTKKRPTSSFTRERNTFAWKRLPFKLGTTKRKKVFGPQNVQDVTWKLLRVTIATTATARKDRIEFALELLKREKVLLKVFF